jgi:hypothetical protein
MSDKESDDIQRATPEKCCEKLKKPKKTKRKEREDDFGVPHRPMHEFEFDEALNHGLPELPCLISAQLSRQYTVTFHAACGGNLYGYQ